MEISEELNEINTEIKKIESTNRVREYYNKHPNKKKEANSKWDAKNRKEYQREYRQKQKLIS